jgi:hypothetical protein
MIRARPFLAVLLALASAASAVADPLRPFGASSGASAAQDPEEAASPYLPPARNRALERTPPEQPAARTPAPPKRPVPVATSKPQPAPVKQSAIVTGTVADTVPRPLAGVGMLYIEVLPLQGDAEKCGLDAPSMLPVAVYPIAASARLKVGRSTLTHMHVRLSAVYVRRLEHCMLHTDVRVSSLQQVELNHSKVAMPAYVPLWEKSDIRLVPRGLAPKLAQERLKQISEQLLIDWAGQN